MERKEKTSIYGLWIGKSLSLMEQLSIKSFLAHGHSFHLYVYDNVLDVPKQVIIEDANKIVPKHEIFQYKHGVWKGSYAAFANIFRYKLLFDLGGIWVDLDTVCLKPFDFEAEYIFSTEYFSQKKTIRLNNTIIKVPSRSNVMKACYDAAKEIDINSLDWRENGSDLLEKFVYKFNLDCFRVVPETFCYIHWWEFEKLIEQNANYVIPNNVYTIHLWNELWRQKNKNRSIIEKLFYGKRFDKNKRYGPHTLYGCLQETYL
ncbi:glycosyltransferase [Chlamydiota bacterium]